MHRLALALFALESIAASATNCEFVLSSAPTRASNVDVLFDGNLVPRLNWSLTGTALTILGSDCEQIQSGLVDAIIVQDNCSV